jgi:hypothetical protein
MLICSIPLNYESLLEIDLDYGGTTSWAAVAAMVKSITPATNEVSDDAQYYDGEGFAETEVTGAQFTLSVTSDRKYGDPAQDFVLGKIFELGCNRKTQARWTNAKGDVKLGACTIANIVPPGGDAASKGEWSFDIRFNKKPTPTPATTAPDLTATVAAGSVAGSTSFTVTSLGADNTLGFLLTSSEATAPNAGAYVSVYAYTDGADLAAVEGQFLNMFELDPNGRVVKYLSQVRAALDIA